MRTSENIPGYLVLDFSIDATVPPSVEVAPVQAVPTGVVPVQVAHTPIAPVEAIPAQAAPAEAAPIVVQSVNNGANEAQGRGVTIEEVEDEETVVERVEEETTRVNLRWDQEATMIFLRDVYQPFHLDLIDMTDTQMRGARWEMMTEYFVEFLTNANMNLGAPMAIITPKKLQDKWAELRTRYHEVRRSLAGTGVGGGTGSQRWLYYDIVHDILNDDPTENPGVDLQTMAPNGRNGINLDINAPAGTNDVDAPVPGRRRDVRRQREGAEDRMERMNEANGERAALAADAMAASIRSHNEVITEQSNRQLMQSMSAMRQIVRESDERWLTGLAALFGPRDLQNNVSDSNANDEANNREMSLI
ncbi:unnamed protein product [Mucor hiemalis]